MNLELLEDYGKKDYFVDSGNIITVFQDLYINNNGHGIEHILEVLDRSIKLHKNYYPNSITLIGSGEIKLYTLAACIHDMFQEVDRDNHHVLSKLFIDYIIDSLNSITGNFSLSNYNDKLNHNNYLKKALDIISLNFNLTDFLNKLTILAIEESAIFNTKNLTIVGNMCYNHRSSLKVLSYDRTNKELEKFVLVFRTADKEEPILENILKRMFLSTVKSTYKQNIPQEFLDSVRGKYVGNYILTIDQLIKIHHHLVDKFYIDGYMYSDKEDLYNVLYKEEIENLQNQIKDLLDNNKLEEYLNKLFPYLIVKINHEYLTPEIETMLKEKSVRFNYVNKSDHHGYSFKYLEDDVGDVFDLCRKFYTFTKLKFNIENNNISIYK